MKINESQLRSIIRESIMNVLEEYNGVQLGEELKQAFLFELDYLYNEGVVAYDDDHLAAIAAGTMKPDYNDLASATLYDQGKEMSLENQSALNAFIKGEDEWDDDIIDLMDEVFIEYAAKNGFGR